MYFFMLINHQHAWCHEFCIATQLLFRRDFLYVVKDKSHKAITLAFDALHHLSTIDPNGTIDMNAKRSSMLCCVRSLGRSDQ
jgi:hypothetical protein